MKIFLDTNVLVSTLTTRGMCQDVLYLILADHELVVSEVVLSELSRVLESKFHLPPMLTSDIIAALREETVVGDSGAEAPIRLRDPSDEPILAAATDASCDYLVSGDIDLLSVAERVEEIRIVSPRQFWELQRSREG